MIDPKELRIGNLVQAPTEWTGTVIEVSEDFVTLLYNANGELYRFAADLIDPIPITPAWLERCGFVIRESFWARLRVLEGYVAIVEPPFGYNPPLMLEINDSRMPLPDIEYVHQLQNLYFALTGSELTITEKATT